MDSVCLCILCLIWVDQWIEWRQLHSWQNMHWLQYTNEFRIVFHTFDIDFNCILNKWTKKVGSFDEVRRSICLKWCDVSTEKRTRILEELQEAYDSLYPQTKVNNVDSWYSWFFVFLHIFGIFLLHFLGIIPKLFFWAYLADFLCIFMRIENIRSVNDSSLITIFGCYWNTSTTEAHWSLRIRIRSDWIRLIQKEEWVIDTAVWSRLVQIRLFFFFFASNINEGQFIMFETNKRTNEYYVMERAATSLPLPREVLWGFRQIGADIWRFSWAQRVGCC